ncbi:MAG: hypothetical protein RR238_08610 [Lachnospiraceae bacterium]
MKNSKINKTSSRVIKSIHRVAAGIMSILLVFSFGKGLPVQAKEAPSETVYVLLNSKGATKDIIVKNDELEEKTGITGELPFTIAISYLLNGEKTEPEAMLGKEGDVSITIEIAPNKKTQPYNKENLALQMQFPIDTQQGQVTDLKAEGLAGVTIGSVRTLSGIVLPDGKGSFLITYHTSSFEQQSVNFVCMPFDVSGMVDMDVSDLESQVSTLQDGIGQYVDGVQQVDQGLKQASTGIQQIAAGGAPLAEGYVQTTAGETALMQGMLSAMTPELQAVFGQQMQQLQMGQRKMADSIKTYVGGVTQASSGLKQLTVGSGELAKQGTSLQEGIDTAIAPLTDMTKKESKSEAPQSFLTGEAVADIQFVMKTDALSMKTVKKDVQPAENTKQTFMDRLLALF